MNRQEILNRIKELEEELKMLRQQVGIEEPSSLGGFSFDAVIETNICPSCGGKYEIHPLTRDFQDLCPVCRIKPSAPRPNRQAQAPSHTPNIASLTNPQLAPPSETTPLQNPVQQVTFTHSLSVDLCNT